MSFRNEFELLLRARYPLIYIPTYEEERVEVAIKEAHFRVFAFLMLPMKPNGDRLFFR